MYKIILVPIDLSHPEQGGRILEIARKVGGPEARLIALYVAGDIPGYIAAELPSGLIEENRKKALAELKALADVVSAETLVRSGHPSTVILEQAEKLGADLIVVASHRPGLEDYFLGSTAARVVRHSSSAVLVDR
jgi:nucleotide-binding universal stress UspA family protein